MMTYSRPIRKNKTDKITDTPFHILQNTIKQPQLQSKTQKLIEKSKQLTSVAAIYYSGCMAQKTLRTNKSSEFKHLNQKANQKDQFKSDKSPSRCDNKRKYSTISDADTSYDALKITTSTTTSSPALLKTLQKIRALRSNSNGGCSIESQTPKIGISDFQVLNYLEEGQFGAVYLARHKSTNFLCALKKIKKSIFDRDSRYITQLIRQIKIQSFLDHPNITQLYGFFDDEKYLYLILQYCSGGNLYANLRKQGQFSQKDVKGKVKQVCNALDFMHDNDIIHRDIKPENILLHEGVLKICDFGWSIHSPLLRSTRCGTPLYSSPQIILENDYDNKVDVWNIGILTYQLLLGKVPFNIRTEDELFKIVDEEILFPKGILISSDCKDFILRCLEKQGRYRISMAELIDHPFLEA